MVEFIFKYFLYTSAFGVLFVLGAGVWWAFSKERREK